MRVQLSTLVSVVFLSAVALGIIAVRVCATVKPGEAEPLVAKSEKENDQAV